MKRLDAAMAAFALGAAAGCATQSTPTVRSPAVIVDSDSASRAESLRIFRQALGGAPVVLAADALTSSPALTIEHARPRDVGGRLLNGRELGRPETFELYREGTRCVLVRTSTGKTWVMRHTLCAAPTTRY